jgi:hypothetical protein
MLLAVTAAQPPSLLYLQFKLPSADAGRLSFSADVLLDMPGQGCSVIP